jgi:hypothetical protein
MDSRAQAAARRLLETDLRSALQTRTLRNLSLAGEPHRLSFFAPSLIRKIDQRSETEKPLSGDFLRAFLKFTRTSDQR